MPVAVVFEDRVHLETRLLDNTIVDDQRCESLEELLLEDEVVHVLVYEVCHLRCESLVRAARLSSVFCEALRLNPPGRDAKTLLDHRKEAHRLLRRYALEDIDSWSARLRCFMLQEPALLNWV